MPIYSQSLPPDRASSKTQRLSMEDFCRGQDFIRRVRRHPEDCESPGWATGGERRLGVAESGVRRFARPGVPWLQGMRRGSAICTRRKGRSQEPMQTIVVGFGVARVKVAHFTRNLCRGVGENLGGTPCAKGAAARLTRMRARGRTSSVASSARFVAVLAISRGRHGKERCLRFSAQVQMRSSAAASPGWRCR